MGRKRGHHRGRSKLRTPEFWNGLVAEYDQDPRLGVKALAQRHGVNAAELQAILTGSSERARRRRCGG